MLGHTNDNWKTAGMACAEHQRNAQSHPTGNRLILLARAGWAICSNSAPLVLRQERFRFKKDMFAKER
jgi:hypothetical protein